MNENYQVIASGPQWSDTLVRTELKDVLEGNLDPVIEKIEQIFCQLAQKRGFQAVWNIQLGQVKGSPEDLQFDIDKIRLQAIDDCIIDFI